MPYRHVEATYVLPLSSPVALLHDELVRYLTWLSERLDVVVVDGSPPDVFAAHDDTWGALVRHLPVRSRTLNGKVAGVADGVAAASTPYVVIADDDVRYEDASLDGVLALLADHDAVVPQNHFAPLPWHARWDTARSLLNRAFGHDYAGTLAVRRDALVETRGYCGAVLFENLELARTLAARAFDVCYASDVYVVRRPPAAGHFLGQRVRQAYDSRAQPARWTIELVILPAAAALAVAWPLGLPLAASAAIGLAEVGRRRYGGRRVFARGSAFWAPLWVAERGVCSWLALAAAALGGVGYRGGRLRAAAHPKSVLARPGCPEEDCTCDTVLRPRGAELLLPRIAGSLHAVPACRPGVSRNSRGVGAVEVTECPGGPLLVRGASAVVEADGTTHPTTRPVVAVCRCGKSGRKPWCDGTHKLFVGDRC